MLRKLLIVVCAITALIGMTQAITLANAAGSDENFGVKVVQERYTENGYEVTLIPDNPCDNFGEYAWRHQ